MKRFMLILLSVATLLSFSSCSDKVLTKEDIYAKNTVDSVLKEYDNVSIHSQFYGEEGEGVYSTYLYADKDMIVKEDSFRNVMIITKDKMFGFDSDNGAIFETLFVENDYINEYRKMWSDILLVNSFASAENCKEKEVSDGRELTFELSVMEIQSYYHDYDLALDALDGYVVFKLNDKGYLLGWDVIIINRSGVEKKLLSFDIEYNNKPYEIPSHLTNYGSEEKRTVTVIADADTDNEKSYSIEVSQGVAVTAIVSPEYIGTFSDKECTIPFKSNDEFYVNDTIIYTKRV